MLTIEHILMAILIQGYRSLQTNTISREETPKQRRKKTTTNSMTTNRIWFSVKFVFAQWCDPLMCIHMWSR